MPEHSLAVSFVVLPGPLVLCSVWPNLNSHSVSHLTLPLALISSSIFKGEFISHLDVIEVLRIALLTFFVPVVVLNAVVLILAIVHHSQVRRVTQGLVAHDSERVLLLIIHTSLVHLVIVDVGHLHGRDYHLLVLVMVRV